VDNITNYAFLNEVFRDVDATSEAIGVTAFVGSPDDKQSWRVYSPFDHAIRRLLLTGNANTYWSIGALKLPGEDERLSRTGGLVTGVFCFPLDDIGTGQGARTHPADVPLPPSFAIETSPENFQYGYLLTAPCRDIGMARALLQHMTADCGDASAAIVSKYVRLPNGINNKRKYSTPFRCRLTVWEPTRRYTVAQLVDAFRIEKNDLERDRERFSGRQPAPEAGQIADDHIYRWLLSAGHVLKPRPDIRGFVEIRCPWHASHTTGGGAAVYSPLGCGGESYAHTRQFNCLHAHCREHTLEEFLKWVFAQRFYMNKDGQTVIDSLDGTIMQFAGFRLWSANLFFWGGKDGTKRITYAEHWLSTTTRLSVDQLGFNPAAPLIYTDSRQRLCFNTWEPPPARAYTTDETLIAPILTHLRYLFDDEYDNALSWFAHITHVPSVRPGFALLHYARAHGTGRGWLKQWMARMLGHTYCRSVSLKDFMEGSFNEFFWQSRLLTFDEIHERSMRFKVQDKLREAITEPRMMINIKKGFKGEADIFAAIMMLSNHADSLQIPNEDRRIWCVACVKDPQSEDYYNTLYNLLDDEAAMDQIYWYLYRWRKANPFNVRGRAPHTTWREAMRGSLADDEGAEGVEDVVEQLRRVGIAAMYRQDLIALCRKQGVNLPLDSGGPLWRPFRNSLAALNVFMGRRTVRKDTGRKDVPLILLRDPRPLLGDDNTAALKAAGETAFKLQPVSSRDLPNEDAQSPLGQ
jgi:hypothetical protein